MLYYFSPGSEKMTLEEFYCTEIDEIDGQDVENAYYMMDLLGHEDFDMYKLPRVSVIESVTKSISTFKMYKSSALDDEVNSMKRYIGYMPYGEVPFYFNTQMVVGENHNIVPTIVYPKVLDKTSYAFLGHEFHHALKDVNCTERKIRDRVAEVIPMFYEMMCADEESEELISKEILKRRLFLLQADKEEETDDIARRLQYFNSYYYALALFHRYKVDKLLILRLISRVLTGEINTLDLLKMLNIYDKDLDYDVSRELEIIKEYIYE
jgi:hypothetical protein